MKKMSFAVLFFSGISLASASSSLGLNFFPSGKVLGTIQLNHNKSNSGYYKISLDVAVTEDHYRTHYKSNMNGSYSSFMNKVYIEEKNTGSTTETISSVEAHITFQTCTDRSYSSCSIIKQENLHVDFSGNQMTGIFPNTFDITV